MPKQQFMNFHNFFKPMRRNNNKATLCKVLFLNYSSQKLLSPQIGGLNWKSMTATWSKKVSLVVLYGSAIVELTLGSDLNDEQFLGQCTLDSEIDFCFESDLSEHKLVVARFETKFSPQKLFLLKFS